MATIFSDNQEVQSALDKLVTLIIKNGGRLNSAIEITSIKGELSVCSKLEQTNHDEIIYVPDICLPSIDDFNLTLDGDKIIVGPRISNNASNLQIEMINLMVDLYNLTGKIIKHRATYPSLALQDAPKVLHHLYKGGHFVDDEDKTSNEDCEIISSFIRARRLNYVSERGCRKVLMPIVDCLNHHCDSFAYQHDSSKKENETGLFVFNSRPTASNECFVRYTQSGDALALYVVYGFVDKSTSVLRSVPTFIDLGKVGKIKVHGIVAPLVAIDKIPASSRDLNYYFPHIRQHDSNSLEVSHLLIPSDRAPFSLRRILAALIQLLAPHINNNDLSNIVYQAETQILENNHHYYDELEALLNSEYATNIPAQTQNEIHLLTQLQKNKLSEYQLRLKN